MATTPYAITYIPVGAATTIEKVFTSDDTTVTNNWNNIQSAARLLDGTPIAYARYWVPAIIGGTTTNPTLLGGVQSGSDFGAVPPAVVTPTPIPFLLAVSSGAIPLPALTGAEVLINYTGGAGGYGISAPVAGGPGVGQDGQILIISSTTAHAHVITSAVDGFNAKGSSGTATFGAAIGNSVTLLAYNGHWYAIVKTGVTIA
jgi:hypothetical protein